MVAYDINQVKKELLEHLGVLNRSSNDYTVKLANTSGNLSDTLDRATIQSENDFTFTRLFREGLSKQNILRALQKIDDGSYGICEECEEEISLERLQVMPDARHCLNCQTQLEKLRIAVDA